MKKIASLVLLIAAICSGRYLWEGAGTSVTAGTTPVTYTIPATNYAYRVSLHNAGSETVFFNMMTATNNFIATNAIPLAAGMTYGGNDDNEELRRAITAVTYATTNGTSTVFIAFE